MLAYIIGGLAYLYIAYMGSVGTSHSSQEYGSGPTMDKKAPRLQCRGTLAKTRGKST